MLGRLNRVDGPACPTCGCRDTDTEGGSRNHHAGSWFGRQGGRHVCRHCGCTFSGSADQEDTGETPVPHQEHRRDAGATPDNTANAGAVAYGVTRCPHCGQSDTRVTSTRGKIRYHKCGACGQGFKSYEQA